MGKGTNIGPEIGIDGESEFRKQIQNINQSLTTLNTEMKASTEEFKNNATSEEALTSKNKTLNKQVGELSDKLKIQNQMLEYAKQNYAEDSEEVQRWQQEVNKTQAALNKANSEIEKNNDLMSEKRKEILKGVAEGFAAIATAAAAAATAVAKVTLDSAQWADDVETLSMKTGLSTDAIQKYQFAAERVDVSLETITGSMAKLTKNMNSAKSGTGATAEAFASLGVSVTNADGSLRDNEDVFQETIKALGQIENDTERDAVAMSIFGKSAQELNPLILGGAEAMEELGKQAEDAGLILSEESLGTLSSLQDAMDTLKATTEGAGHMFSVGFASPMASAINLATGYMQKLTASFDGSFESLGSALGEVLTDITKQINQYLPQVIDLGMEIIMSLVEGITSMLPDILQTCVDIIVVMVDSLSEHLPELIPVAVDAILTLTDTLISNIDQLVDASITLIMALADGLIDALPILIEKAPILVSHLVSALVDNVPKLLEAAVALITTLASSLLAPEQLKQILNAAVDIVMTVVNGIKSMWQNILEVGINIVEGIIEGITSSFTWAYNKIKEWFNNVLSKIKDFLGIHSPSTVFAEIGKYMAEGIAVGWNSEMGAVSRDINDSMSSLLPSSTANIGVVSTMRGTGVQNAMASSVNAIGSLMGGNSGNLTIQFVVNGREFSRAILPDFRMVQAQNPIIVNDF